MKKILTASLVAMMAVSAANADIASTNYVGKVADTKVNLDQTADNKNKAMITNANGIVEPGQIIEGMIASNAVTTTNIKDLNVTTDKLNNEAVTEGKLAANAVTNAKLAADAVKSENILNETIVNADISPKAAIAISKIDGLQDALDSKESGLGYTPEDVANKYKTTDNVVINDANKDTLYPSMGRVQTYVETVKKELSDGVAGELEAKVDEDQGEENANLAMVTDEDGYVVPGQIVEGMIANDAVTTTKIKNAAVTTDKLDNAAVTEVKLATDAVTTNKIKNLNVTTDKLGNGAVTEVKLATDAVTTTKIKDLNVTTAKIANKAVTTDKLDDSAVTEVKLADDAVTTDKIKDLNVTKEKLAETVQTSLEKADNIADASRLAAGQGDGTYTLTMSVSNNVATYKWEMIDRGN